MSLNWHIDKVENFKELCYREVDGQTQLNPKTHALIFLTMSVGMSRITQKNYDEFFRRVAIVEDKHGCFVRSFKEGDDDFTDHPVTLSDVKAHIGLGTNAACFGKREFNRRHK